MGTTSGFRLFDYSLQRLDCKEIAGLCSPNNNDHNQELKQLQAI